MVIFNIFILLILFFLLLLMLVFFYESICVLGSAPFIPVAKKDLALINQYLKLTENSIFYDLGSGDGRVLEKILELNPEIKAYGFEINFLPFWLSKIRLRKYKARAKIYRKNFFRANIADATHIFLYLYPNVMAKLEKQFAQQLTPGTKIVSIDFKFKNLQPEKTLNISGKGKITKELHLYTWK